MHATYIHNDYNATLNVIDSKRAYNASGLLATIRVRYDAGTNSYIIDSAYRAADANPTVARCTVPAPRGRYNLYTVLAAYSMAGVANLGDTEQLFDCTFDELISCITDRD